MDFGKFFPPFLDPHGFAIHGFFFPPKSANSEDPLYFVFGKKRIIWVFSNSICYSELSKQKISILELNYDCEWKVEERKATETELGRPP